MQKQRISTAEAPVPVARYSQGIRVGNTLYVQGIIALDPLTRVVTGDGIRAQSERVFRSIAAILEAADMTMGQVVKVTAFLADLADYPGFNEVYNATFTDDPPPVRTTVQAALPFGALVEVEVTACATGLDHAGNSGGDFRNV